MPAEVVPGLYCLPNVGLAVNAFIWHPRPEQRGEGEPVLFDCGWPWSGRGMVASLAATGCRPEELRTIAITHDDVDHVGRLAPLQAISGAAVAASAVEAPRLAGDTWRKLRGKAGPLNLAGVLVDRFDALWPHHPVVVDRPLQDGDELPGGWIAVYTPGHTPGHTAYFHPTAQILIAGDALSLWGGRLRAPLPVYTEDSVLAAQSIRKLAALRPETICFGHGGVLRNAAGALQAFAAGL